MQMTKNVAVRMEVLVQAAQIVALGKTRVGEVETSAPSPSLVLIGS